MYFYRRHDISHNNKKAFAMKGLFCKITPSPFLKRIFGACLLPLFAFLFCLFALNTPTSAVSVVGSGGIGLRSTSYIRYSVDGGSNTNSNWNTQYSSYYSFSSIPYTNNISFSQFNLNLYNASLPAHSLANFRLTLDFYIDHGKGKPYLPSSGFISASPNNYTVLSYNCSETAYEGSILDTYSLTCDFHFYTESETSSISIYFDTLAYANGASQAQVKPSFSRISYITFDSDALSADDKDWLSDDFISALQQAEADAQKEANEDVKDQTETQTQSSSSTANSEGGDSEQAGLTLLQAFSGFVSAITNVSPAQSCDFDLDFSGYHSGLSATVDMCSLSPPAGLTFIGSILLILFCVPLSISTVRRMISLFRSFQT